MDFKRYMGLLKDLFQKSLKTLPKHEQPWRTNTYLRRNNI